MSLTPRSVNRHAWADRLERFGRSGQTVAQFCSAEGVSSACFYRWRRKLQPVTQSGNGLTRFVPLELPGSQATGNQATDHQELQADAVMSIQLPGGIQVRLEVTGNRGQSS
jgi:transposase-like protein